jgi:16S rRNA (uracil1498-N3)-methyltransferase
LPLPCVNHGGPESLIRLCRTPALEEETALPPEAARALSFWSARLGEVLTLVGPDDSAWRGRLSHLAGEEARVVVFEKLPFFPESRVHVTVFQALPQKERFELVLQKLTEIGVDRLVPFVCRRSITPEQRDQGQRKSHRWPEVVLRAAKQCRRALLPELSPVLSWQEVLEEAAGADLRLLLYEKYSGHSLGQLLRKPEARRIALVVGPEGGFTEDEVDEAGRSGLIPVSLGSRILRTETAAIIGAAIIQFSLGEFG